MKNFTEILDLINKSFTPNLTKEVDRFPIEGYRFDQLALPKHSISNVNSLNEQEHCVAITTDSAVDFINNILKDNFSEGYIISASSFMKNTEITIYIEKIMEEEDNIKTNISFNVTHKKIEFGKKSYGKFRLEKETVRVVKAVKFGTYTEIPYFLEKKEVINMTPIDFIEARISQDLKVKLENEQRELEAISKFKTALEASGISYEELQTLKQLEPYNYEHSL